MRALTRPMRSLGWAWPVPTRYPREPAVGVLAREIMRLNLSLSLSLSLSLGAVLLASISP